IRAMTVGEVRLRDWWRVVRRELGVGLVLGILLGLLGMARVWIASIIGMPAHADTILFALTIAGSLTGVVIFGAVAGSMLPFILRRLGFDPAAASAPLVATLVDVSGLLIYFSVASWLLGSWLVRGLGETPAKQAVSTLRATRPAALPSDARVSGARGGAHVAAHSGRGLGAADRRDDHADAGVYGIRSGARAGRVRGTDAGA